MRPVGSLPPNSHADACLAFLMSFLAVMHKLCSGWSCLQGRPVPCHLVHWYVAQMQPAMADALEEFLALSKNIGDQEEIVIECAQQLLKVNDY